jgi:hypothetical protein
VQVLDTLATTVLFIVLIGWVGLAVYVGAMSVMLSDSGAPGIGIVGVALAVVGTPLSVVIVYVIAVIRAWRADGHTFYYPVVAFVVGTALAALVWGVALGIVGLGLHIHGTDEERGRDRRGRRPRDAKVTDGDSANHVDPASVGDAGASATTKTRGAAEHIERAQRSHAPSVYAFVKTHEHRDGNLFVELGIERATGRRYVRTPMPQRNGEYEEYYGIDVGLYETLCADAATAFRFADECRRGEHTARWMPLPGWPMCKRITRGRKHLARKRATLLTDHPTDSSGVPVEGFPVGTPFVWIVGNSVDPDGNLQVRLPGNDAKVVCIDADQLGIS